MKDCKTSSEHSQVPLRHLAEKSSVINYERSPISFMALVLTLAITLPRGVMAEEYFFWITERFYPHYPSGPAVCKDLETQHPSIHWIWQPYYFDLSYYKPGMLAGGHCLLYEKSSGAFLGGTAINFWGDECINGGALNPYTGECELSLNVQERKIKGLPEQHAPENSVQSCAGNPIDFSSGNKFQAESDYNLKGSSLAFARIYNSTDGLWRGKYFASAIITPVTIMITFDDGYQALFNVINGVATPEGGEPGALAKMNGNWVYRSKQNEQLTFDIAGKLVAITQSDGETLTVSHAGNVRTISNTKGNSITVNYFSNGHPLSLSAAGVSIQYGYNQYGFLASVTKTENGQSTQRTYHYEDPRNRAWLTGITDERGIRYATWTYDDQGRAISSEHAGGAERTLVSYNADGSSTVTNALGKRTTYRFQTIQGIRRITAIEGAPSANCPNSDSTFTYDDRGLVKTRTDNKGRVTTFDYNERGLEVSRTEAYGTPQARTVTTEWHSTLFLPATVTEPDRVTSYSYDEQGRLVGQATTQR
ncbi:DUF6531 domain-containing protein [Pseudomonas solani]|uniref:DUF6531 domain-containing protein n=1 Tax=Pseudomonas solani TaxID=2731552 RepID=UPI003C2EC924